MALKCLLLLAMLGVVRAQLPGFGSCPEFKPVEGFDMNRFLGTWYENERYFSLFEVGTRCARIEYSLAPNGKFLAANTITSRITGITRVINGELKYATANKNEGRLAIRYEQLPVAINSEYSVVATDYDNYAVLWSCSSPVPYLLTTQNAWLMTREAEPTPAVMNEAIAQFEKLGINRRFINKVDQKSCTAAAEAAAAAAATTPAVAAAEPTVAPTPAVRNQQVHIKPEVNAVEAEIKKPVVSVVPAVVVKDEPEVKPVVPEVKPVVPVVKPVVPVVPAVVKDETVVPEEAPAKAEATPEPEPAAEPEPATVPEVKPVEPTKTEEAKPVESEVASATEEKKVKT